MRVVFLGCGYLGTNLQNLLEGQFSTEMWGIDSPYVSRALHFHEVDAFDPEAMAAMDFQDAVLVDSVALVSSSAKAEDEEEVLNQMAEKYRKLFQVMKKGGLRRFVFFSSGGTVYGSHKSPRREEDPVQPVNLYARSKLRGEKELQESGLDYLILRLSNPYGGYQISGKRQGVIPILLRKAYLHEPFTMLVDPATTRDYIYITDFARALAALLEKNVSRTIVNIGSGSAVPLQEVMDRTEALTGEKLILEKGDSSVSRVGDIVLDTSRLQKLTGWKPEVSLAEGMTLENQRIRGELGL